MTNALQYSRASDDGGLLNRWPLVLVSEANGGSGDTTEVPAAMGELLQFPGAVSSTETHLVSVMSPVSVQISTLGRYALRQPLSCVVEKDADEWLAQAPDVPQVFGLGATVAEAVEALKCDVCSLYDDLRQDDNFTADWLAVHDFLSRIVQPL